MKKLGLFVFLSLFVLFSAVISPVQAAVSDTPISNFPSTNGHIYSIVEGPDNTVFLGGDFSMVGTYRGHAIPLNTTTGAVVGTFPEVHGRVRSVISDGSSGWYIGGDFTQIGNTTVNRLAHINSDGTLDTTWNPGVDDGRVYSVVKSGSTIYVGGSFTAVNNGTTRNRIAAFTTSSATATSFNPNMSGGFTPDVFSLTVSSGGTILYAGGNFTSVNGGTTRNHLAAFTTSNGTVVAGFNPNINGGINDMVLTTDDTILYVAGSFDQVNGATTRNNAAAFTTSNGTVVAGFNPNLSSDARSIALSGSTLYYGGSFNSVNGGTSRNQLAAFGTNGTVTSWNANIVQDQSIYGSDNSAIRDILVSGSLVYVAGEFNKVNTSTERRGLAALATSDATASSWNPSPDAVIDSLALSGTTLLVGGPLTMVGGSARTSLAQIDLDDYSVTSWNPLVWDASSALPIVTDLAYTDTTVYVVGDFDHSGTLSTTRNNASAFLLSDGSVTSWDPNIASSVQSIAINGSKTYLGGGFSDVNNGTTRNYAAAFNLTDGTVDSSWNPNFNDEVVDLEISGSTLYAGGYFSTVNGGGANRYNLAATNLTTGTVTSWNPDIDQNGYFDDMELSGDTLYVVGFFETVNGSTPRTHLAGFNLTDGTVTSFNPVLDFDTYYLGTNGSQIFIQGDFSEINGVSRSGWGGIHISDNTTLSWNPTDLEYGTNEMTVVGSLLLMSGDRLDLASGAQTGILAFTGVEEDPAPSPSPSPSSSSGSSSSGSSSSGSSSETGGCSNSAPQGVPDLFEIDVRNKSATLFFAPVLTASDYFVRYGQKTATNQYGTSFNPANNQGVQSFTINELNPNTVYSFQIRGGRGCATGEWSRILTIRTTSSATQLQKFYTYSIVGQKVVSNSTIKKSPIKTTTPTQPIPIIAPELPSQTTQPRASIAPKPSIAPSTNTETTSWWQKVIDWFK